MPRGQRGPPRGQHSGKQASGLSSFQHFQKIPSSGMSLSVQLASVCPHAKVLTQQCSPGENDSVAF